MRVALCIVGLVGLGGLFAVAGCATTAEDTGEDDAFVTPTAKATLFEQAQLCDALVRDKAGVRAADVKSGVVRWKCGDVDGVTFDKNPRAGFGQEYCEFHAMVDGKAIDDSKRPTGTVECAFTSVFSDAAPNDQASSDMQKELKSSAALEAKVTQMQVSFNSRLAATALINDCTAAAQSQSLVDAERQVACLQAWKSADEGTKDKLKTACKGVDLSKDDAWAKVAELGVKPLGKDGQDFDATMDVVNCTQGLKVPGIARTSWRNSDPTICARVMRAVKECGVEFTSLPDALPGFAMTSWIDDFDPATPPAAPVGCRYMKADDQPYQRMLVCTPSAAEVTKAKQAGKVMQQMCKEQFGNLIAMAAPLGAVVTTPTDKIKSDTPFCQDFQAGVKALKGE
jgi:hypothetical protein